MKIIKWSKGKKNTYILETEKHEPIILYDDVVLKYELLLKKEISEKELTNIIQANQNLQSYYVALNYLSRKMRSEKEVIMFLKQKKYSTEIINQVIFRLKKEGYINDLKLLEAFINDSLNLTLDGPLKIKKNLEKIGIDGTIAIGNISSSIWNERINKLVAKKEQLFKDNSIFLAKQKLSNYLYLNGYEKEMFENLINDLSFSENLDNLKKEKEKIVKRLSSKYQGKELNYHLKIKLYQKGYRIEDIEKIIK